MGFGLSLPGSKSSLFTTRTPPRNSLQSKTSSALTGRSLAETITEGMIMKTWKLLMPKKCLTELNPCLVNSNNRHLATSQLTSATMIQLTRARVKTKDTSLSMQMEVDLCLGSQVLARQE